MKIDIKTCTLRCLLLAGFCITLMSLTNWQTDFDKAKQAAKQNHKLILLNFSGSDWCGPCMRMKKEIFESEIFSKVADSLLICVNADFPRDKKHKLDKATIKQNETLADKYNASGNFPFTVLLNAEGKVIKEWNGLPRKNATQFADEIKSLYDANK